MSGASSRIEPPNQPVDPHPDESRLGHDSPHISADKPTSEAVMRELELIFASPYFHASKRSQQFLGYVVQYKLAGNEEQLKERTIGSMLFQRPADYATGDDSVVRVQAGEVRRRLEQYYQTPPAGSLVRIELPVGAYTPEIRWASHAPAISNPATAAGESDLAAAVAPEATVSTVIAGKRKNKTWVMVLVIALVLVATAGAFWMERSRTRDSALQRFWSPMFVSSKPLLICLPKTVLYRPSLGLYKRGERTPGEFDKEVDRMNGRPHLQPEDKIVWGDMFEDPSFGLGKGDIKATFRLSALLGKLGKETEVRIGSDYAWDDLRSGPAVIIGAFSNQASMKILSGLPIAFVERRGELGLIEEQGPKGRSWLTERGPHDEVTSDYGLIARLVNSGTGQFVVVIAGITDAGSEAAADVASSKDELQEALRSSPPDWARKNVEMVVKTSVTDGVAGPPQIVAVNVW